jgi:hypothetical protein
MSLSQNLETSFINLSSIVNSHIEELRAPLRVRQEELRAIAMGDITEAQQLLSTLGTCPNPQAVLVDIARLSAQVEEQNLISRLASEAGDGLDLVIGATGKTLTNTLSEINNGLLAIREMGRKALTLRANGGLGDGVSHSLITHLEAQQKDTTQKIKSLSYIDGAAKQQLIDDIEDYIASALSTEELI